MLSMRAMGLENQIDDEFDRFERLKKRLDGLLPGSDQYVWVHGEDGDDDPYENIEKVRKHLLKMLDSTYKLEGLLHTRGVLMN